MRKHTKVYLEEMGFTKADFIPCERCGSQAVDIHHIDGRGEGKDVIENLMALCRPCHDRYHTGTGLSKEELQGIHNDKLMWSKEIGF